MREGSRGAPGYRSPAMAMNDVYRTPAAALDSLVARSLQPCPEFLGAARRALGTLAAALRKRGGRAGAQPWRVLKIAKVGASGRGGGHLELGQSSEDAGALPPALPTGTVAISSFHSCL